MLWPDTFNNYFLPDTAKAAVEVLEAAGFRVIHPDSILCCGRPLYDFGMLERAKRLLLKSWTLSPRKSKPEFPSSFWSPVVPPSFATN